MANEGRAKVADQVAERVERLIVEGVLKVGQALPSERRLVEKLGCSRSALREGLRVLRAGLELGAVLKNRFEPAHAWALWLQTLENSVSFEEADPLLARYLSGDVLPSDKRGWTLVQADGLSLGWAKGDGSQLKNHYPKALRRPV